MSSAVIVTTPEELRAIVRAEVRAALAEQREPEPAEWLDTAGAAELLGVHPRTIARMANRGELPCTRVGRLLRFERDELLAWLERSG